MDAYRNSIKIFNQWKENVIDAMLNRSEENLKRIADLFVEQILLDRQVILAVDPDLSKLSDCAVHIPRIYSSIDKQTGIGHQIANKLYPIADASDPIARQHSYIQYHQEIRNLKAIFYNYLKGKEVIPKKDKFEKAKKLSGARKNFCELKKKPISDAIINPVPMHVEVADLDNFKPFLQFVEKNGYVHHNEIVEFDKGAHLGNAIDLCKQVVGPHWIANFVNSMENNVNIEHFLIGNNIIGDGVKHIAKFITETHLAKIKTWYLAGNQINNENIKSLTDALSFDVNAEALWLKRNPIKTGAIHIANMLEKNTKLKVLDLHNTGILDEGVQHIFGALKKNRSLRALYLDANAISEQGAVYIKEYFEYMSFTKNKGITSLWLDMNRLDDNGSTLITSAIKNYPYMKRLILGSNRISSSGAKIIFEDLVNHPTLFVLDLGLYKSTFDMGELPNNIGDDGVPFINEFLKNNTIIKIFSIQQNNISKEGLQQIADSLITNDNKNLLRFMHRQYTADQSISNIDIKQIIDRNCAAANYPDVRYIMHTKKVDNIYSIYRNSM